MCIRLNINIYKKGSLWLTVCWYRIHKILVCKWCVDLGCHFFIMLLLPGALWMVVRRRLKPGGRATVLQGWKLISNQANQCQKVDRLMRVVWDLMNCHPICHAIVIYLVQPYHLSAILHNHTLLGQFVRVDRLFVLHSSHQLGFKGMMWPLVFLDWIKLFSGERGLGRGEPSGLWPESISH